MGINYHQRRWSSRPVRVTVFLERSFNGVTVEIVWEVHRPHLLDIITAVTVVKLQLAFFNEITAEIVCEVHRPHLLDTTKAVNIVQLPFFSSLPLTKSQPSSLTTLVGYHQRSEYRSITVTVFQRNHGRDCAWSTLTTLAGYHQRSEYRSVTLSIFQRTHGRDCAWSTLTTLAGYYQRSEYRSITFTVFHRNHSGDSVGSTLTTLVGLFRHSLPLNKCSDDASSVLIAAYLSAVWQQEVAVFE